MSGAPGLLATGTGVLKALQTLRALGRGQRGRRRQLLTGLGELLDATLLHTRDGVAPRAVIRTLDPGPMAEILASDLDFKTLRRGNIAAATTRGVGFYKRYVGWSTERLYAHIYRTLAELRGLAELRRLAELAPDDHVRLDRRLGNLQKLIVLFIWHVGEAADC